MTTAVVFPPLSAFKKHFSSTTWERGASYARIKAALVFELVADEPSPGWWSLEADVQGSDTEPYEVSVQFKVTGDSSPTLWSQCSCPVGLKCKHAAAALITALSQDWSESTSTEFAKPTYPTTPQLWPESLRPKPAPAAFVPAPAPTPAQSAHAPLDRWLSAQRFALEPRKPSASSQSQTEQRLVYVLSSQAVPHKHDIPKLVHAGEAFWLCLWPAKIKPLKSKPGQWSKPALLKKQYGGLFGTSEWHGDVFHTVRRWIRGQTTDGYYSGGGYTAPLSSQAPSHAVYDSIGLQMLRLLLDTGDVVTLDEAGQIEHTWRWSDDAHDLSWTWQAQPEQAQDTAVHWRATADLGSDDCVLRLCAPALYMDTAHHTVGLVNTTHNANQLRDWLQLPPLPQDWVQENMPRLMGLTPSLPAPVVAQAGLTRVVQNIKPVAHLRLANAPKDSPGLLTLHLSFDYDGVQGIWPDTASAQQWVDTAEGRVMLTRELQAEAVWAALLFQHGYRPPSSSLAPATWTAVPGLPGPYATARDRDQALLSEHLPLLREQGFVITLDVDLAARMRSVDAIDFGLDGVAADGSLIEPEDDSANARWFSLSLGFEIEGQSINLLPWLPQLLDHISRTKAPINAAPGADQADDRLWLFTEPDQWWHVPVAPLRPWLAAMLELVGDRRQELLEGADVRLSRFEAMRLAATDNPYAALALSGAHAQSLQAMVQALKGGASMREVDVPEGLQAQLRPYQRHGLNWLQFLAQHQLGGVLADDMGLGKTLQTIAHLLVQKHAGRLEKPALVVAPTSLVGNWRNELQRFAPSLRTLVLHGAKRSELFDDIAHHDVVITTYPLLNRDQDTLVAQAWSVVVLDEAQNIKNTKSQAAAIVQCLDAAQRLCLSGTPMENHLGEIWSLFQFLMPGYLSTETRFKQLFRTPIEKHGDTERLTQLRTRLAPFMLRRNKALVASELPPKVETIEYVPLEPAQAKLYETIRLTTEQKVREALNNKGLARSHITVLDALLKLRQVCCDPRLVPLTAARKVKQSAKLDWLLQNLPEMVAEGRRILLFSQFTSMLDLIEQELPALGLAWVKLTGQSTEREALIERFTSGEVPLFLISLKAGGVGLNLPQADTVIHYDPWWNPAVEDQATDRAHRLGQTQTVFVHKLVAQGTLEERILALQARKAELARGLHGQEGIKAAALTEGDLDWLLQPMS